MTEAELMEVMTLVRAVGREEVMPRFRKLRAGDVATKSGPADLVTVADEQAEARLTAWLERRFPGCLIVGEEAMARDKARLGQIAGAPLCFVIDPIDGTFNYAAGLPLFGVMVAVVEGGATTAALIHYPVLDETAVALAGQGAWLDDGDGGRTRLRAALAAPLQAMSGSVSWRFMPEPRRSQVCTRLPRLGGPSDYHCSAAQYRLLATGHFHYSVYNRLLPWDHAAGVLLHQEAGGYAALLDGSPYSPARFDGGMICAPDRATWQAIHDALFKE